MIPWKGSERTFSATQRISTVAKRGFTFVT
jgi:hypothetical protein